ncbi:hypothetical protein OsI_16893 [Oryza sativa Indica Group]|uniref:Uncharacterized protein n=1 Tax=Oryza sativa subsp. indica TaxID=39946 RepID=B8ASQ1_ORYSI|nr:hypothetical protein OsI_16893 [Oryza sativa Indica Group]
MVDEPKIGGGTEETGEAEFLVEIGGGAEETGEKGDERRSGEWRRQLAGWEGGCGVRRATAEWAMRSGRRVGARAPGDDGGGDVHRRDGRENWRRRWISRSEGKCDDFGGTGGLLMMVHIRSYMWKGAIGQGRNFKGKTAEDKKRQNGCHHPLHSPSFARIRNTVLALDGKGATCSNSVGELVEGPLHEVDIANKLKCARLEGRAEQKVKIVSNSRLIWLASLGVRACIS